MSLKRKLMSGGAWAFGGKIVSIVFAVVLNLLLTRNLTPADYGAYFVCLNTVIILMTTGILGLDQTAIRLVAVTTAAGHIATARRIILACLGLVCVAGAVVVAGLAFGADWLFVGQMKMPQILPSLAIVLFWLFTAIPQRQVAETFRGLSDIRLATIFGGLRNNGFLFNAMTCAATGALVLAGALTLQRVLLVMAASSAAIMLLSSAILARKLRGGDDTAVAATREEHAFARPSYLLSEGWPLWLSMLVTVLNNQGVGWLAAKFDVPANVALYGLAQQFAILSITPAVMGNSIMPPIIAELYSRGEMKRLERVAQTVAGLVSIPCAGIFLVLLVGGHGLIGAVFGHYYYAAYTLVLIMCAGQIVNVATGSWQVVLPMVGQKNQMLLLSLFSAVLQVVTGVIGGKYWGVYGVATSFCLTMILSNVAGMIVVRRKLGIWTFVRVDRKVFADLVAMAKKKLAKGRNGNDVGNDGVGNGAAAGAAPGSKGSA